MFTNRSLIGLLLLPLAACTPEPDEAGYLSDFAGRLTGDLQGIDGDLARTAELAAELPDVVGRDGQDPECVAAGGDCEVCYDVKGLPLEGNFTIAMDPMPCGLSATSPRGLTATYTVAESALEGTWTGTLVGDYTIEATGTRAANLSLETTASGTLEYDSGYEITLTATTEATALDTYEIAMTYGGFDDRVWEVEVEGTTTGVLGTVTSPGGVACTVDGTFDDVDVACTGPESEQ